MFKQVFLYTGEPFLAYLNDEGEYDYPEDAWTEVAPPEGIYSPYYFDGNQWIGNSKEDWEINRPVEESMPSENDELNTQLIMNDLEHNLKIEMLEQDIANLTSKLLELQGGN